MQPEPLRAGLALAAAMWRINSRNRVALVYGYVFPLLFLIGFWAIYRSDPVPLALHAGQFLTVTVLGAACFGLPTAMVSEREQGVWRRYVLTPTPPWVFVATTLLVRFALLLTAVLLQLALALALGMPLPAHPLGLVVALLATAFAFLGLGAVIAMLVPNVPAVQALGQCIFLPMLIVGGVAVPLASLPDWALALSAYLPGRHAVMALQASATGLGLSTSGFALAALLATGASAFIVATRMFRWEPLRRGSGGSRWWLLLVLATWAGIGMMAGWLDRVASPRTDTADAGKPADFLATPTRLPYAPWPAPPAAAPAPAALPARTAPMPAPVLESPEIAAVPAPGWQSVTSADFARIAFDRLPPDNGLVAPIAGPDETADPAATSLLEKVSAGLAAWPPARVADPEQRVRNLLYVAAVPDLLQIEQLERFLPLLILQQLQVDIPAADLPRILYWVAMNPDAGEDSAIAALPSLGLPATTGPTKPVRGRTMLYAFKLLGRLSGS
jgi:ABC-2 type transport system permease protein